MNILILSDTFPPEATGGAAHGLQMLKALPYIVEVVPQTVLLVLSPAGAYSEGMLSVAESLVIGQYIRFAG